MHDDSRDIDYSIQLEPISAPAAPRKAPTRWWVYLVVGGGGLLSVGAVLAMVGLMARTSGLGSQKVVVTAHGDPAAMRAEAARVFGSFDKIVQQRAMTVPDVKKEWDEIAAVLEKLESCAGEADHTEFRQLVDFDRLLKRVDLTGNMQGWTLFDKRSVRTQMKMSSEVESYWSKIVVAGVVRPNDDASSRVVYALGWDSDWQYPTEIRIWLARDGDSWKIYDWEQLDLGVSESREWGLHIKYADSRMSEGFERWSAEVTESDTLSASGDREAAKEKLRGSEAQMVAPEFEGFRWVLTGYRWAALDEFDEAQRCYEKVTRPEDTPGAYFGLMNCYRWTDRNEALRYAQLYEGAVGPNLELLETKAQLLEGMGRKAEAVEQWKKLLRMQPDNVTALGEFVLSLPEGDKLAFELQFEQLGDPVAAAANVAQFVGYRDYPRLVRLVEYLERKAPDSAGALYVAGMARLLDGQYEEAADLYLRAFELEADETKRKSYIDNYVEAMTACGKVVEAWHAVPEPKQAFESLFYYYDEGETELTEDEYRQLVELYRERYPDEPDGMEREAALEINQKQYERAETLLRKALQQTETSEAEVIDYYRESFATSLALVIYKLDRIKDAYESVGDRRERFAQLTTEAIDDKRWPVVKQLIEWHRAAEPDDVEIHYVEGELAAQEKRWDDALRLFRQSLEIDPDHQAYRMHNRLAEISNESGRWRDYYLAAEDQGDAFERLAVKFIYDKNWEDFNTLLAEHRQRSPEDLRIVKQESEAAWARKDYAAYIPLGEQLLAGDDENVVADYERQVFEKQLMSALLRSQRLQRARQLAQEKRQENEPAKMAIVEAASGNVTEAVRLAREAAAIANNNASVLYLNEDVGPVFLSEAYAGLHRDFPVPLLFNPAPARAVFIFDSRRKLQATDIYRAMKELNIDLFVTAEPLESARSDVDDCFALKFANASIWLATGEGKFYDLWKPDDATDLANAVNNSRGWLAVGTAAWTDEGREQVEEKARLLCSELAGGDVVAICTGGQQPWESFGAYQATPELLLTWKTSGNIKLFEDEGLLLLDEPDNDVEGRRAFNRSLHELVRAFESAPGSRLEVVAFTNENLQVDPLRLDVRRVRRTYSSLEFDGVLKNNSKLIPELRAGLPMRLHAIRIQAAQLNDEKPVRRP